MGSRTVGGLRGGGHDRVVRTGQTDTAYLTGGRWLGLRLWNGHGTPVVLVHGLLDCALGWQPYAQRTSRRLVAVDVPGFGGSDLPRRPQLSAYAEDVLEALDEIGVSRFMAVGHSLGGGVAAAMADRAPGRVAGLVLIAPVGFGRVPTARAFALPGVSLTVRLALPLALGNRIAASIIYRTVVANGVLPDSELLEVVRTGLPVAGRACGPPIARSWRLAIPSAPSLGAASTMTTMSRCCGAGLTGSCRSSTPRASARRFPTRGSRFRTAWATLPRLSARICSPASSNKRSRASKLGTNAPA